MFIASYSLFRGVLQQRKAREFSSSNALPIRTIEA
jgi:hypothetical protein